MTSTSPSTSDACERALLAEQQFIAAVEENLVAARGRLIAGVMFETIRRDSAEAVHKAMVDRRMFGTELRRRLPQGQGVVMRGYRRRLLFGRRPTSVTVASVLSPPGPLLDGGEPPPVTLGELTEHVRELIGGRRDRTPHLVAVCSPSGFAPDVWTSRLELHGVKIVLVEPRPGGGWKVAPLARDLDERLVRLFDPEGVAEKLSRIRGEIETHRTDLLLSGLSAREVASRLGVPARMVETVFEHVSRGDPELRVSRRSGEVVLFRGAPEGPAAEDDSMSVAEWIRSLFSRAGNEAKKINVLIERRNALALRRDRLYEDIANLERREQALLDEGKRNTSSVVRRRVAAQVAQLRKEIERWNTIAAMLNQQINVIATDIHNLTLIQQGQLARLPSAEELTEHAVAAEEMLETLAADAKLVDGLEAGIAQTVMTEEEAAVLRELEAADAEIAAPPSEPAEPRRAGAGPEPAAEPAPPSPSARQRETPQADA